MVCGLTDANPGAYKRRETEGIVLHASFFTYFLGFLLLTADDFAELPRKNIDFGRLLLLHTTSIFPAFWQMRWEAVKM